MKSQTLPSFWEAYPALNDDIEQYARKAYRLTRFIPLCTSSVSTAKKTSGQSVSPWAAAQQAFLKVIQ